MCKKQSLEQGLCSYILKMLLASWPRDLCWFPMWCSFAGAKEAPLAASQGPQGVCTAPLFQTATSKTKSVLRVMSK